MACVSKKTVKKAAKGGKKGSNNKKGCGKKKPC